MKRKKPESVGQTENMTTIVTGKLVLERNECNKEALKRAGKTVIEHNGTSVQTLVFFGPPCGAVPRAKLANGMTVAPNAAEANSDGRDAPPAEAADSCKLVGVESPTNGDASRLNRISKNFN